jgi:hypothetical protein
MIRFNRGGREADMKTNQRAGILMCVAATAVMTIFGASADARPRSSSDCLKQAQAATSEGGTTVTQNERRACSSR